MVGTLATLLFYNNQGFFTGVGAWIFGTQPADISSFVGVAVTVAAFLLLTRYGTRRVAARGGA
jgi:hypothetical protein